MGAGSLTAPADAADGYAPLPMGPGYVLRQDNFFRLDAWCSVAGVTLTLAGQIAGDDGCIRPFVFTLAPTSNRALSTAIFPASPGTLLCCQVIATSGTPARGQCFVRLELLVGKETSAFSLATIVQQYVTANVAAAYPGSELDQPDEGPGWLQAVVGVAPAAGAEVSQVVPTNARWRLATLRLQLATSATVGNRVPKLLFDDGANIVGAFSVNSNIAASNTVLITWATTGQFATPDSVGWMAPIPTPIILPAAFRLRTLTAGIVAGDQYGAPIFMVEEWLDV